MTDLSMCFQAGAVLALQEAPEDCLVGLFEDTKLRAILAKRLTITANGHAAGAASPVEECAPTASAGPKDPRIIALWGLTEGAKIQ